MTLFPGGQEIIAGTWDGMFVEIGIDGTKRKEIKIDESGGVVTTFACAGETVVVGFADGGLQLREAARLDHVVWSFSGSQEVYR